MSASTPGSVFRVRFDTPTYDEDLQRVRNEGRTVATDARSQLERDGIAVALLSACHRTHATAPISAGWSSSTSRSPTGLGSGPSRRPRHRRALPSGRCVR